MLLQTTCGSSSSSSEPIVAPSLATTKEKDETDSAKPQQHAGGDFAMPVIMPRSKRRLESSSSTSDSDSGSNSGRLSASMSTSNLAKERDRRKKKMIRLSSLSQITGSGTQVSKECDTEDERRIPSESSSMSVPTIPVISIDPPTPKLGGLRRMVGQTQLNAKNRPPLGQEDAPDQKATQSVLNRLPIWKQKPAVDSPLRSAADPFAFLPSPASSAAISSHSLVRKKSKSTLAKARSSGKLVERSIQMVRREPEKPVTSLPSQSSHTPVPAPSDTVHTPPQQVKLSSSRANASPHPGAVRSSMRKKLAESPLSSPCLRGPPSSFYSSCSSSTSTSQAPSQLIATCSTASLVNDHVPSFGFGIVSGRCSPPYVISPSDRDKPNKDAEQSLMPHTPGRPSTLRPSGRSHSDLRHTRQPVTVTFDDVDQAPSSMDRPLRVGLTAHQSLFNLRMTPERRRSAERELAPPIPRRQATPTRESELAPPILRRQATPTRESAGGNKKLVQELPEDAPVPLPERLSPRKRAPPSAMLRSSTTVSDLRSASKLLFAPSVNHPKYVRKNKETTSSRNLNESFLSRDGPGDVATVGVRQERIRDKELGTGEEDTSSQTTAEEKAKSLPVPPVVDCFITPNQSFTDLCTIGEEAANPTADQTGKDLAAITIVLPSSSSAGNAPPSSNPPVTSSQSVAAGRLATPPIPQKTKDGGSSGSTDDSDGNEFYSVPSTPDLVKKVISVSSDTSESSTDCVILSDPSSSSVTQPESSSSASTTPTPPLRSILRGCSSLGSRPSSRIRFAAVDVFYFGRQQGGVTVPYEGETALAMVDRHFTTRRFPLDTGRRPNLALSTVEDELSDGEVVPDEFMSSHHDGVCSTMEMERIQDKKRVAMLRKESVQLFRPSYHDRLEWLRKSRRNCGCSCKHGICRPETCECQRNGMQCQVDGPVDEEIPHITFPCPCSANTCHNKEGRIEFDRDAVSVHHATTMKRLRDMEITGIYCSPRLTRFDEEEEEDVRVVERKEEKQAAGADDVIAVEESGGSGGGGSAPSSAITAVVAPDVSKQSSLYDDVIDVTPSRPPHSPSPLLVPLSIPPSDISSAEVDNPPRFPVTPVHGLKKNNQIRFAKSSPLKVTLKRSQKHPAASSPSAPPPSAPDSAPFSSSAPPISSSSLPEDSPAPCSSSSRGTERQPAVPVNLFPTAPSLL